MPNPACCHIFHDGHSCGSPALRNQQFCYFHHTTRRPRKGLPLSDASAPFQLPIPEDRSAILASIALIMQRVAAGSLDASRAAILLRALKLAQQILPGPGPLKSRDCVTDLDEIEFDDEDVQPCTPELPKPHAQLPEPANPAPIERLLD